MAIESVLLIVLAAGVMLSLAIVMTFILGWANKALHVEVDQKVQAVDAVLPGANCGGCGYLGCSDYAEAVVNDGIAPNLCPVGGEKISNAVANILGVELGDVIPMRPAIYCMAKCGQKPGSHEYRGEQTCATASLVGGYQGCVYGCLGLGDCCDVCLFDAIHIVDDMVQVDYRKCVGCGACVKACPRDIIANVPFKDDQMYSIACRNTEKGKDVKEVCSLGCRGCSICQRLTDGLIVMKEGVATFDYDKYDPGTVEEILEPVLKKCPSSIVFHKIGVPEKDEPKDDPEPPVKD